MGAVYRATDLRTGGPVAVKALHPALARDPVARERLRREAQAAAVLTSPRVVRVVDLACAGEAPFLVLEYVAGETLQARWRREGRLAPGPALAVVREVARALEEAHAQGIVHRDLTPRNVMLADGQVKVLDFGIARVQELPGLTAPGALLGTPAYAPPEWASGAADARADLYALGVILFALLEGEVPFRGPTALAVLRQHAAAPLPQTAHAPPALLPVLRRCLAKDPAQRYQSAAELVAALDAAAHALAAADTADTADTAHTPHAAHTADMPHPLPVALSSFVGREREGAEVLGLLRGEGPRGAVRLLTLTGPGGTGKTRLALHAAAGAAADYPAGVRLVELAPLADAALVPRAVAAALGVRETPGQDVTETLLQTLRERRLLLVLDNCEHLLPACAALAETLLRGCPRLQVLATSRQGLGVQGETTWPVPALGVPATAALPLEQLAQSEAVRLFVERAASVSPGFVLTERNGGAVAEVCRRLDGLPLAIELAAARVRTLSVEQIGARLDHRLRLLTSGRRAALPHQQTLRASVDWSYGLLAPPERHLLRRLAVFAGGWTLEAAEAVCAVPTPSGVARSAGSTREPSGRGAPGEELDPEEVLDVLGGLVDKSLVVAGEAEPGGNGGAEERERRYTLQETVRQYALEKLLAAGEAESAQARHAAHYLTLAEQAEPALNGPQQKAWLGRLEREHDNLRAALRWAIGEGHEGAQEAQEAQAGQAETALRLGAALAKFWTVRGYQSEGQRWLDFALARAAGAAPARRARACYAAGRMARARRDYGAARARYEECLSLWREVGNRRGVALALASLGGVAGDQGLAETARALHEESLALRRASADRRGVAQSLNNLGMLAFARGDYRTAAALQEESLALHRELRDTGGVASALLMLGQTAGRQGDLQQATRLCSESLDLFREVGNLLGIAMAQRATGQVLLDAGQGARAEALLQASLESARHLNDPWAEAASLVTLASAARRRGDLERAEALAREGLALAGPLGTRRQLAIALETLAGTAAASGRASRAARLFGAAGALRDSLGMPRPEAERARYEADLAAARQLLGPDGLEAQLSAGRALSLPHALSEAQGEPSEPSEPKPVREQVT
jgi:non-specific serine/threonine protein kinase